MRRLIPFTRETGGLCVGSWHRMHRAESENHRKAVMKRDQTAGNHRIGPNHQCSWRGPGGEKGGAKCMAAAQGWRRLFASWRDARRWNEGVGRVPVVHIRCAHFTTGLFLSSLRLGWRRGLKLGTWNFLGHWPLVMGHSFNQCSDNPVIAIPGETDESSVR